MASTRIQRSLSLLAVGLTVGLVLGLSWRLPGGSRAAEVNRREDRIAVSIERLEREQRELKASLSRLRQELAGHQQAAAADTDRLEALRDELQRQQILAGLTAVEGPGVRVLLDDSQALVPAGVDASSLLIHEQDLRDIVNVLWMAGSEAVAVNEERLVANSSVYCVGSTVMVNNTRLSPPYVIRAIGNSRVQQDYLRNPSYLRSLKDKQRLYGLRFEVGAESELLLPAYGGGLLTQHARLGE